MTFEKAVAFIFEVEGGIANIAGDPGGLTKFGISRRSYPNLDIANLTQEQAVAIYKTDYWEKLRCAELPNGLDLLVFDAAVNQGQYAAAKMLQTLLDVPQDGIIGAETIRAAQTKTDIATEYLAQRMYHYALIPQILQMGRGWYRRLAKTAQLAFSN